jgi:hypothetical protein
MGKRHRRSCPPSPTLKPPDCPSTHCSRHEAQHWALNAYSRTVSDSPEPPPVSQAARGVLGRAGSQDVRRTARGLTGSEARQVGGSGMSGPGDGLMRGARFAGEAEAEGLTAQGGLVDRPEWSCPGRVGDPGRRWDPPASGRAVVSVRVNPFLHMIFNGFPCLLSRDLSMWMEEPEPRRRRAGPAIGPEMGRAPDKTCQLAPNRLDEVSA